MASATSYNMALEEAEKAVKKQRTCESKVQGCLDQLIAQVEQARQAAAGGAPGSSAAAVLQQLGTQAEAVLKEANASVKELHGAVNKLGKSVDGCVDTSVDMSRVMRDVTLDKDALHKVMAQHFFRQGLFEVGHALLQEVGLPGRVQDTSAPFTTMHIVLDEIRQWQPELALQWAKTNLQRQLQLQNPPSGPTTSAASDAGATQQQHSQGAGDIESEDGMAIDGGPEAEIGPPPPPPSSVAPRSSLVVASSRALRTAAGASGSGAGQLSAAGLVPPLSSEIASAAAPTGAVAPLLPMPRDLPSQQARQGRDQALLRYNMLRALHQATGEEGGPLESLPGFEHLTNQLSDFMRALRGGPGPGPGPTAGGAPAAAATTTTTAAAAAAGATSGAGQGAAGSSGGGNSRQQQQQQQQRTEAAKKAAQRAAMLHVSAIQDLQFRLHALSYLTRLTQQGQAAALEYARSHFSPFARSHMRDIQQLMGCLVFCRPTHPGLNGSGAMECEGPMVDKPHLEPHSCGPQPSATTHLTSNTSHPTPPPTATPATANGTATASGGAGQNGYGGVVGGSSSSGGVEGRTAGGGEEGPWSGGVLSLAGTPYAHLLRPSAWEDAAKEFSRLACSLMGLAAESPLATVVAAGAAAIPTLHKMMSVLTPGVAAEVRAADQLPVELDLGPEFVFHPIFACPVSRDQSTGDNPPLLLPCGHVLCEQSVLKIAKSRTRVFKCPYCPVEARADNLRTLTFPELD